jgi:Flp pilus assembly protein TadG
MSLGTPHRRQRRESGSAAVEFALVLPLLLMIIVGVVSYGYLLSFRQAMSQGATEGARAAAVSAYPTASLKVADAVSGVNDALGSYGVSCQLSSGATTGALRRHGVSVGTCGVLTGTCANNSHASCVSVQVTYDYDSHPLVPELPGLGVVMPDSLSYTAVAQVD